MTPRLERELLLYHPREVFRPALARERRGRRLDEARVDEIGAAAQEGESVLMIPPHTREDVHSDVVYGEAGE